MKYLNKIIEYGLYLLVFLLPIETRWIIKAGQLNGGPWEYGTYSLYGTDILLIILLALFIIYSLCQKKFLIFNFQIKFKSPAWWFIWGLILVSAMSVFFALDKFLAIYKFGWLIAGVGLFWLVTTANYDRLKLIYAMLGGAFLQAGLGIGQFLSQVSFANKWFGLALHRAADLGASVIETVGADGVGERWLRAYGGLDHPNLLGGLMAVAILLLISERLRVNFSDKIPPTPVRLSAHDQAFVQAGKISNPKWQKFFIFINWLLALVFTAGLFFSFSRSAWLALASGLAVMIVLAVARGNLKLQKGLAEIILIMGILLLVLSGQYQNLISARLSGEGRLEAKSNFERLASYQASGQIIKENLLRGTGLGNYTLALRQELPQQASYFYQPTHNVFLLVWAETGILGIIFFAGLIIYTLILNYGKRADNNCAEVNPAILAAMLVIMLFDHWLWSLHFGVLFLWFVLGLVYRKKWQNH